MGMDGIRVTARARGKLASRDPRIEEWEPFEVWFNPHVTLRNKKNRAASHRLVGRTDHGRLLTILVRPSSEDRVWDVVNGWDASKGETTLYKREAK